jgi:hypothetical protein
VAAGVSALAFGLASPDAEAFAGLDGVLQAFGHDGADGADRFGRGGVASPAGVEQRWVDSLAGAALLPVRAFG